MGLDVEAAAGVRGGTGGDDEGGEEQEGRGARHGP